MYNFYDVVAGKLVYTYGSTDKPATLEQALKVLQKSEIGIILVH